MIAKDKQALSNGRAVQVGLSVIQTRDGKSVGNRDLIQGPVPFENLLNKGTFIIRFRGGVSVPQLDIVEIFLPPAKRCIFLNYTLIFL